VIDAETLAGLEAFGLEAGPEDWHGRTELRAGDDVVAVVTAEQATALLCWLMMEV